MTVPVRQAAAADNGWRVAFMLPGEYTLETAPARRRIRGSGSIAAPGKLMARARATTGRWTEGDYETHRKELLRQPRPGRHQDRR